MMFKIKEVLDKLQIGYKIFGHSGCEFYKPSESKNAEECSITFCMHKKFAPVFDKQYLVITSQDVYNSITINPHATFVIVDNPKMVFIKIIEWCFPLCKPVGIHPSSFVNGCVRLGKNVVIHQGCTIGFDGFGHYKDENGFLRNFPHHGGVVIEDDVEVFQMTNIDRGTLGDTIIGKGTKIDHQCHIAHNVKIGKNCIIIAGTVIGGSATIGDNVYIGINSCIRDWVEIGDNAVIGMGSVVVKNVEEGETVYGNPAKRPLDVLSKV